MMSLSKRWVWLCAAMSWIVLSASAARAALVNPDFQIGPNISLDSLSIAAGATNYLVAWRDLSGAPNTLAIAGSFVSATGIASAQFAISDAQGIPQIGPVQRTRAAFDGTYFFVVWHDLRPNGTGVRGALITPQGTVVGGADFFIAGATNTANVNPQVVFTGSDYLVVWQDAPLSGTGTQIFYTRVTLAGFAGTISSVPPLAGHDASQQLELLIAGAGSETAIVYQDIGATPNATYAVRIAADNSIAGPVSGTFMFTLDFSPTGAGAPIGGAFLLDTQEYLILASKGAQIDCFVSRAWLKPDGRTALSTAPLALVGQGKTGLDEDNFPRAFFNGTDEFIFPRNSKVNDFAYHIFMKRVNVDGTDNDPNMAIVDTASNGILNGAVAAAIGSQYLVVWMDGRRLAVAPPLQTNVYGALIDGTQPGNLLRPYIRPGAAVSPLAGAAPLTCAFGGGSTTGLLDSGQWDFGDGTTSTVVSTTHQYVNAGSYLAVFSILRSGLNYNSFFHIDVASNDVGGGGGPAQTVGGLIGPISPGINNQVLLDTFTATLNFTKTSGDAFRLTGKFDVSRIPLFLTGQTCTFSIGTNAYTFNLLVDGTFASATGTVPFLTFQLAPATGAFVFTGSGDMLAAALAGTGVDDTTVSKLPVSIPVSAAFAGLSTTQTIQAQYTATAGKSGKINYQLTIAGAPGEGFFVMTSGTAVERLTNGKTGFVIHDFGMLGNLTLPGSTMVVKDSIGVWRITFGNYSQDIPVGSLILTGTIYSFKPKNVKSGITQFSFNQKTGLFFLGLKALPAQGEDASGMALSNNLVTRADMAVSFDLDLDGGTTIQAGDFLRLARKDVTKKKWSLR